MERLAHIIETQQFTVPWLEEDFFPLVDEMDELLDKREKGLINSPVRTDLTGKNVVEFFYGASTRTMLTFQFATRELNAVNFATDNAGISSSAAKGESLRDTIKVISSYRSVDVIAVRTPISQKPEEQQLVLKDAVPFSTKPIINAGDRNDQHPTQTLIDLYTIKRGKGKIGGLIIGLGGDVGGSRTVRSLIYLAAKYLGTKFIIISPKMTRLPNDLRNHLQENHIDFQEVNDVREVAPILDVYYVVRIQTESSNEKGRLLFMPKYGTPTFWSVNQEVLDLLPEEAIILHPLPRTQDELPYKTDSDPRSRYFQQAKWGDVVRMALLLTILKEPYKTNFLKKTNPLVL
ncbi:MAG: aspartate carbamoyltransferase [Candidatus Nealsonbacteria bacterium]